MPWTEVTPKVCAAISFHSHDRLLLVFQQYSSDCSEACSARLIVSIRVNSRASLESVYIYIYVFTGNIMPAVGSFHYEILFANVYLIITSILA